MKMALAYVAWVTVVLVGSYARAADGGVSPVRLHIGAKPAAEALNEWAQQTGFRVVWADDVATNVLIQGVDGTFTPQQALEKLVAQAGLSYDLLDDHTVA